MLRIPGTVSCCWSRGRWVLRERRSFDFHPGVHGKRLEDDLHVYAVPGPPEAQRARRAALRGQLPQPEQVPLLGELTGALRLLRLSLLDALSGPALPNADGHGCEELSSAAGWWLASPPPV